MNSEPLPVEESPPPSRSPGLEAEDRRQRNELSSVSEERLIHSSGRGRPIGRGRPMGRVLRTEGCSVGDRAGQMMAVKGGAWEQ